MTSANGLFLEDNVDDDNGELDDEDEKFIYVGYGSGGTTGDKTENPAATWESESVDSNPELELAAEMGKMLLEQNKMLENHISEQEKLLLEKEHQCEFQMHQLELLRDTTESHLRHTEELESHLAGLEADNHQYVITQRSLREELASLNAVVKDQDSRLEEMEEDKESLLIKLREMENNAAATASRLKAKTRSLSLPNALDMLDIAKLCEVHNLSPEELQRYILKRIGGRGSRAAAADDPEVELSRLYETLQSKDDELEAERQRILMLESKVEEVEGEKRRLQTVNFTLERQLNDFNDQFEHNSDRRPPSALPHSKTFHNEISELTSSLAAAADKRSSAFGSRNSSGEKLNNVSKKSFRHSETFRNSFYSLYSATADGPTNSTEQSNLTVDGDESSSARDLVSKSADSPPSKHTFYSSPPHHRVLTGNEMSFINEINDRYELLLEKYDRLKAAWEKDKREGQAATQACVTPTIKRHTTTTIIVAERKTPPAAATVLPRSPGTSKSTSKDSAQQTSHWNIALTSEGYDTKDPMDNNCDLTTTVTSKSPKNKINVIKTVEKRNKKKRHTDSTSSPSSSSPITRGGGDTQASQHQPEYRKLLQELFDTLRHCTKPADRSSIIVEDPRPTPGHPTTAAGCNSPNVVV